MRLDLGSYMKNPAVIITGLPWLRTGTGKVMEAQIDFFKSLGWDVLFVACPHNADETYKNSSWDRFREHQGDLRADAVMIASFEKKLKRGRRFQRLLKRWQRRNAMHWHFKISAAVDLKKQLRDYVRAADVKLILVNHVYTLEFGKRIKKELLGQNVPLCLVTHDVQSHILLDNSVINPFTKKIDPVEVLVKTEVQALSVAQYLIHVSYADLKFFQQRLPNIPQKAILPSAPDNTNRHIEYPAEKSNDLLFVGSNHIANFEAIVWLLDEVYPNFSEPKPSLRIVGTVGNLVKAQRPDLYERYKPLFFGEMVDLMDQYADSRCVLIPMISGRGVSIKTIEATSMGLPIVGATAAFRGLPPEAIQNAGLHIYSLPAEFAAAAEEILRDSRPAREASTKLYHTLFSSSAFAGSMLNVLDDLGLGRFSAKNHGSFSSAACAPTET